MSASAKLGHRALTGNGNAPEKKRAAAQRESLSVINPMLIYIEE
jgi:hypothetical protein